MVSPAVHLYTLSLDYNATGEGLSVRTMLVVAPSEERARERFWSTFFGGDALARSYFGPGLDVTPGLDRSRFPGHTAEFLDRLEELARSSGAFTYLTYRHFNAS